jgi:GH43 family beta-xylosidase
MQQNFRKLSIIWITQMVVLLSTSVNDTAAQSNENANKDSTFQNPLLPGGADPWVIEKNGVYYYMSTNGGNISIWKTSAVTELGHIKPVVVWQPPASGVHSRNIWAPELHYLQGKWYLYYSAGSSSNQATQRVFVLENNAADPTGGTWIDKGEIRDAAANHFSIDGSVFQYKHKTYFIWSGTASDTDNIQRIYIAEMKNPWTLKTHRIQISMPQYEWEKIGGQVNEGPEALINPTGDLFITFSVSQCSTDDYGLGILRLKAGGNPLNPADWIKHPEPVFSKSISHKVFGPGHNGFFQSKDGKENWIIYHANAESGQGCGGARSPRIQKFTWNKDGSPNFGEPVSTSQKIKKPSGEY